MMKKIIGLWFAVVLAWSISVPALAIEFTPSVENKLAPDVITQTDSNGDEVAAIIYDGDGDELVGVPEGSVIITPYSLRHEASGEIAEALDSAYEQLVSVSSLSALSSDLGAVVEEFSEDLTVDDLAVRDLFDVTVTGIYAEYLSQIGTSITIRFNLSTDAESLVAVLHNVEGTTWETASFTRNIDCTADVTLYSLGQVAFLFDVGTLSVDPDAPDSPQTGEPVPYVAMVFAVGGMIIVIAVAGVVAKKGYSRRA